MYNGHPIIAFGEKYYPEIKLTKAELDTLSWCLSHPITTPSGEADGSVHYEVKRLFKRLTLLALLQEEKYAEFINPQTEPKMAADQFKFFASKIKELDADALTALRAMIVISAIPMTAKAKMAADDALKKTLPVDSIEFLAVTLEHCPEIYPVYTDLKTEEAKLYLQQALKLGHLRHMLYVEGNQGMYQPLQKAKDKLELKYFTFWYVQWFINTAGFKIEFDAVNEPRGSQYLHARNTGALIELYILIHECLVYPRAVSEILPAYLKYRFEQLDPDNTYSNDQLHYFFTQIACWSRIYSSDNKLLPVLHETLTTLLPYIPPKILQFHTISTRTSTYSPALFDNCLALLPNDPSLAFKIALSIYFSAWQEYINKITAKDSFTLPPLSFRLAADKKSLQAIIEDFKNSPAKKEAFPYCAVNLNEILEVCILPSPQSTPFLAAKNRDPAQPDITSIP